MPKRFAEETKAFLKADAAYQEAKFNRALAEGTLVDRMETYRVARFVSVTHGALIERGSGDAARTLSVTKVSVLERP
jgi:hypothetical protein